MAALGLSTDELSSLLARLEMTLRRFTCLTMGDTILMLYNNKRYFIDILETRPTQAVTVIEARITCSNPGTPLLLMDALSDGLRGRLCAAAGLRGAGAGAQAAAAGRRSRALARR